VSYSTVDDGLLKLLGLSSISAQATAQTAMGVSTFFGCVRLISDLIASQPFGVFRSLPQGGSETVSSHPLHFLLHTRFNPQMSSYVARRTLAANMLVYGEAIAYIQRDERRQPIAIIPYPTPEVAIYEDTTTGALFFKHATRGEVWTEDDVIYLKELNFKGSRGASVINWQRQNIKVNLLSKGFLEKYYEKGTFVAGLITSPFATDQEKAKIVKDRMVAALQGDENGGLGLAVLQPGTEYHNVSRSPVESQLMEFLSQSDKDIAKAFGVPLFLLGDTEKQTSYGTGVDSMFIAITNTVIIPKAHQIEQEFDYKCFRRDEIQAGYYTKHNFRALLRGDAKTYAEYVRTMIQNGVYNQNEVRALEELPPAPGGDQYWIQQNMMPLDKAEEILTDKANGTRQEAPAAAV
jgi:HK97 family phage portal protein